MERSSVSPMQIANPIYDVVFKYLLEDNQLAKLVLSTILGEELVELELRPQERTTEIGSRHLTVYRLDFSARIRSNDGRLRLALIEIQKAKLPTDIMRFRRYLGEQYRDPNNLVRTEPEDPGQSVKRTAIPLVTIYFLGYPLDHIEAPVVRIQRECVDVVSGERLNVKEPFVEGLTHDSTIIQISRLRPEHRTELEEMLTIFDQHGITRNRHLLEIDEAEVSTRFRPLLRRLQKAIAEPEVVQAMDLEDEILEELQALEREIERKDRALAKERAEKEKGKEENERLLAILKRAGIDPNTENKSEN